MRGARQRSVWVAALTLFLCGGCSPPKDSSAAASSDDQLDLTSLDVTVDEFFEQIETTHHEWLPEGSQARTRLGPIHGARGRPLGDMRNKLLNRLAQSRVLVAVADGQAILMNSRRDDYDFASEEPAPPDPDFEISARLLYEPERPARLELRLLDLRRAGQALVEHTGP